MSSKRKLNNAETEPDVSFKKMRNTTTNQLYALSYEVIDVLENSLIDLVRETHSECALVVDRTGCIMASHGSFKNIEPSSMGATAAATSAALSSFAPKRKIHEACVDFFLDDSLNVYFTSIEERLILCVLNKDAKSKEFLEKCRLFAKAISNEIENDKEKVYSGQKDLAESVSYIENKLDQLFKDHLTPGS